MSKKESVRDILIKLIHLLDEQGIIEISDLLTGLKQVEAPMAIVRFRKNIDYKVVAKYLEVVRFVFLAISRKRAWYACQKLKELTKKEIEYVKIKLDDTDGYLFSFKEDFQRLSSQLEEEEP